MTRRSKRSTAGNRMEAALAEFRAEELGQDVEEDKDFVMEVGMLLSSSAGVHTQTETVQTNRMLLGLTSRARMKKVIRKTSMQLQKEW